MASSGDPLDDLKALKTEELHFLASVAKRAFQSVLRHGGPIDLKTTEDRRPRRLLGDTLYIASLAFDLPNPNNHSHESPPPLDSGPRWRPGPYNIVEFRGDEERELAVNLPLIAEQFIHEAQQLETVREAPHFVLLNELSHAFEDRADLNGSWSKLASRYETYVVPGTFHCTTEYFSVAPIHCPDPRRNSYALKLNAAAKQKEKIRTPDARELYIFETDFGNVILWICLDMYDPGLVLKFLNVTHRFSGSREESMKPFREVSLVLVPAYSTDKREDIRNCVRSISRFSKTAMVCANTMYPDRQESYGFSCGEPLREVLHRSYTLPRSGRVVCEATLYGVDLITLRASQAANYSKSGIFSSAFTGILTGDYTLYTP